MAAMMMNPLNINCKKCVRSFDRGEQMSLYNNNYYHNTCFVCNFCEQSLAGQGFFTKPDGSFQCKRCHEYHTPKCFICNNSIADGVKHECEFDTDKTYKSIAQVRVSFTDYNIYQGKHFHKTCFKCIKCQGMIPEGRSFSDTPEGIKCLDCAKVTNHGHQGPKKGADTSALKPVDSSTDGHPSGRDHVCAKCVRPIPPNTVYGIYEGKQYHQECFSCNRCNKNLINNVCRRLGSAIVCKDCD